MLPDGITAVSVKTVPEEKKAKKGRNCRSQCLFGVYGVIPVVGMAMGGKHAPLKAASSDGTAR